MGSSETSRLLNNFKYKCTRTPFRSFILLLCAILKITNGLYLSNLISITFPGRTVCGDSNSTFYSEINSTLANCLLQCGKRSTCVAVNFKRRSDNFCELLLDSETTATVVPGCLYIARGDIDFRGKLINSCGCSTSEVCDLSDDSCNTSECPPVKTVPNGQVLGDIYTEGSQLYITCDPGYQLSDNGTIITCMANGNWSVEPNCIPTASIPLPTPMTLPIPTTTPTSFTTLGAPLSTVNSPTTITPLTTIMTTTPTTSPTTRPPTSITTPPTSTTIPPTSTTIPPTSITTPPTSTTIPPTSITTPPTSTTIPPTSTTIPPTSITTTLTSTSTTPTFTTTPLTSTTRPPTSITTPLTSTTRPSTSITTPPTSTTIPPTSTTIPPISNTTTPPTSTSTTPPTSTTMTPPTSITTTPPTSTTTTPPTSITTPPPTSITTTPPTSTATPPISYTTSPTSITTPPLTSTTMTPTSTTTPLTSTTIPPTSITPPSLSTTTPPTSTTTSPLTSTTRPPTSTTTTQTSTTTTTTPTTTSSTTTTRAVLCPSGWLTLGFVCFFFPHISVGKRSFHDAEAYCISIGGHLASVGSVTEDDFINYQIQTLVSQNGQVSYWIGMEKDTIMLQWSWTDGSAIVYDNWRPGQPQGLFDENCLLLWDGDDWGWHDVGCGFKGLFVCRQAAVVIPN